MGLSVASPTGSVPTCPYLSVLGRELVTVDAMGFNPVRGSQSPFRNHIAPVVSSGAKEEVVRVYAGRVVAGVANEQALGDGALVKAPRKSVCSLSRRGEEYPVALGDPPPDPDPATVRPLNLRPKPRHHPSHSQFQSHKYSGRFIALNITGFVR
jgi:hypothetical protein